MKELILSALLLCWCLLCANVAPIVSNASAAQRTDGSYLVDVYYSVQDTDSDLLTISLMVSSDGGNTWNVSCDMLSGDIGANISPGANKHIIWNLGTEHPNIEANYHFKVTADDGYVPPLPDDWVFVQGGTYILGDTRNQGTYGALPLHQVTLSDFYIEKYEVTQNEWLSVMGYNPSVYGGNLNRPIETVSWFDCINYCNTKSIQEGLTPCYTYAGYGTIPSEWPNGWNSYPHDNITCNWLVDGYRLLSDAEWEYAARGGVYSHNFIYSGSDNIDEVAWWLGNNSGHPNAVGTKSPNELGIYDMTGNLHERVWDFYSLTLDSSPPYIDPHGPLNGTERTRRGSSFVDYSWNCVIYFRGGALPQSPETYYSNVGFRVARSSLTGSLPEH